MARCHSFPTALPFAHLQHSPHLAPVRVCAQVEYYNDEARKWDDVKFRFMLLPAQQSSSPTGVPSSARGPVVGEAGEDAPVLPLHQIVLQMVGAGSASQVYMLSLHTIDPAYQVHLRVENHQRVPIVESRELVHRWHPLMAALRLHPAIRVLVRVKPDGWGTLADMCGCC